MKIKGFTLAEVLITLVIIGVIAAITVPTIITGTRKSEFSARLKKFYGTISQAQIRASALGDSWEIWCDDTSKEYDTSTKTTEEFAKKYLLPHIVTLKSGVENGKYTIYLNDGTSFYLMKEQCIHFVYDVNGPKRPNVSGRDIYRFNYCPSSIDRTLIDANPGIILAYSWQSGKTRAEAVTACKTNPDTCSKLLLMDGWQYSKDYPHSI